MWQSVQIELAAHFVLLPESALTLTRILVLIICELTRKA